MKKTNSITARNNVACWFLIAQQLLQTDIFGSFFLVTVFVNTNQSVFISVFASLVLLLSSGIGCDQSDNHGINILTCRSPVHPLDALGPEQEGLSPGRGVCPGDPGTDPERHWF